MIEKKTTATCDQNVSGKFGDANLSGYTHGKATQSST